MRDEIGPDRTLLVDAVGVSSSAPEAIRPCRAFEPCDPYFVEEPVMIDRVETMSEDGYIEVPERPDPRIELDEDVTDNHRPPRDSDPYDTGRECN